MTHRLSSAATASSGRNGTTPLTPLQHGIAWLFGRALLDEPMPWWQRYGTACMTVAAAFGLRTLFDPVLGGRGTYGFFLIATAFVDWRCGLGPALLALGLGTLLGCVVFDWPHDTFAFDLGPNWVPLLMSLCIGAVTVLVCESLRTMALENARLYREAKLAEVRKDDFLAMLAHELRNPLAPIRNALYILDMVDRDDQRTAEMRRIIGSQTNHLVRLVDDLLDVARITRGKIELRPTPDAPLAAIVESAVETARPIIDEKQQELRIQLPPSPIALTVDPVRLTQVLANLLNNAAKYTDKAGRIWLTAEVQGGDVVFRVRDTGVGLSAEQLERVFLLFEQADASIEKSRGGLGIGLTLARVLVEMHGGTLSAASGGVGLGSEFTVRLPLAFPRPATTQPSLADAKGTATASPPTAPAVHKPASTSKSLRVLIVEDVEATANSLATILELWQHEVAVCYDGFSAQEKARTFLPQVVLADLGLPQMSGLRLAEELRQIPALDDTVLVALSGYGQARDRERSQAAGFTHHLTKPIEPNQLREILETIAARRALAPVAE